MFSTKSKLLFISIGLFAFSFSLTPVALAAVNAAPHLGLGTGARSLGLGGAFTAVADDATSTVWNPAGLPSVKDLTFTVSTAKMSYDRKHNFLGVVKKLNERNAIGFAWVNAGIDGILRYDGQGNATGERFDYGSNAFSVAFGSAFEQFSVGGSLRILTDDFGLDDVDGASASGFGGIDLGFIGRSPSDRLSYGIALRNLAGSIGDSNIPVLLDIGAAFKKSFRKNVATFSMDLEREFVDIEESTTSVRIGAEYAISNLFAIRGGAKATRDRRSFYTGFGVNVSGIQLDYALKLSDDTVNSLDEGNTHFVSLSYTY